MDFLDLKREDFDSVGVWARDVALFLECLPSIQKTPALITSA